MARTAGQLDKAERTYRALLLVVRRTPPGDDEAAVGPSEVLFELHKLAATRGESDQAKELLESAMEAAIQSDAEVRRLRRSLLAHGEGERLLEVLEQAPRDEPRAGQPGAPARRHGRGARRQLGRGGEALDALIKAFIGDAVARRPPRARARAREDAPAQTKKFVEAVESVVDRLRRKDDPPLIANLLMQRRRGARAGRRAISRAPRTCTAASRSSASGSRRRSTRRRASPPRSATPPSRRARSTRCSSSPAPTASRRRSRSTRSTASPRSSSAATRAASRASSCSSARSPPSRAGARPAACSRWPPASRPTTTRSSAMYERVARNGGDQELLLDFLERRAALPARHAAADPRGGRSRRRARPRRARRGAARPRGRRRARHRRRPRLRAVGRARARRAPARRERPRSRRAT